MSQQPFPHDAGTVPATPLPAAPPLAPPLTPPAAEFVDGPVDELDGSAGLPIDPKPFGVSPVRLAGRGPKASKRLVSAQDAAASNRRLSPEQKLLILDTWQKSGLSAHD